jgi:putative endonuclease
VAYFVYILHCVDGSYYVGMTNDLQTRLNQHNEGAEKNAYTFSRRPVELVWYQEFDSHDDAFRFEQQIKGWNRKKKEALIQNNWEAVHEIVMGERRRRERGKRK